jgi:cytochrome c5
LKRGRHALLLGVAGLLANDLLAAAPLELSQRQATLLRVNCVQCHAVPGLGAPLIGDRAAWQWARERGEDAMLSNVLAGVRGMPPLGYCSACSEADFRALIRFLADLPATSARTGERE